MARGIWLEITHLQSNWTHFPKICKPEMGVQNEPPHRETLIRNPNVNNEWYPNWGSKIDPKKWAREGKKNGPANFPTSVSGRIPETIQTLIWNTRQGSPQMSMMAQTFRRGRPKSTCQHDCFHHRFNVGFNVLSLGSTVPWSIHNQRRGITHLEHNC